MDIILMYIVVILAVSSAMVLIAKAITRKEYTLLGSSVPRLFLAFVYASSIAGNEEIIHANIDFWITLGVILVFFSDTISNIMYLITRKHENVLKELQLIEALSKLETKYHTLVENSPVGIYSFEAVTGKILYVNPVLCATLGYDRDEVLGKTVYDLVVQEDHEAVKESIYKRLSREVEVIVYDLNLISKKGDPMRFTCQGRIVYNGKANILGFAIPV